jgi:hypothetical protein
VTKSEQNKIIFKQPAFTWHLSSIIFLLLGLALPAFTYISAEDVNDSSLVYEVEESRKYIHDMELLGGKMNVLAMKFTNWFNSLWHGKPLAYTICCITVLIFIVLVFVDYYSPSNIDFDDHDEKKPGGTG